MASGCVPKKEDRLQALKVAKEQIKKALDCLESIDDPDDNPRGVEDAMSFVCDSLGKRQDGFVFVDGFIDHQSDFGLADLCEHYFS
jgi:hypothetical protein